MKKKRWRAESKEIYFFINDYCEITSDNDFFRDEDDARYYFGNYFETEEEISKFFQRANLTVVLGSYFVSNAEGFVRLNIGMQRYKVEEAFNRIKKMYDSYK